MKKNKSVIMVGIILLTVIVLLIAGAVIAERYLENQLQNQQIGAYHIRSGDAGVNLFLRQVTIQNAQVEDSATNKTFTAPEIKATGIHIFPFIFNDKVVVNKLFIRQPEINLLLQAAVQEKQPQEAVTSEQELELELIHIKQLEMTDAAILLERQDSGDADTLISLQAELEITNLNIFSNNQQLKLNNHSTDKINLQLTNGVYYLPGGLYKLQFGSISLDTEQEMLNLEDLHFSSLYPKYEIAGQTGVETDWYDILLNQLRVEGINSSAILQDTALIFRSAVLEDLNATIFRDKRPPFPDKPDSKLPVEMLESLPFPVHTDSILIKNGSVVYEEHAEESKEPGRVTFNSFFATFYNLGTLNDSIDGQTALTARARVMDQALLKVEFVFPNQEYSHQYQASGSLEATDAAAFNPMLVPAAFVRVEEGRIKQLTFDFTYDNNKSEGSLALEYENLNISLLDKEDGSQETVKTFLTETFVLQEDNLKENNSYQKGTISFERDKKKSIFNYWWKSLFSGIKDIMAF